MKFRPNSFEPICSQIACCRRSGLGTSSEPTPQVPPERPARRPRPDGKPSPDQELRDGRLSPPDPSLHT